MLQWRNESVKACRQRKEGGAHGGTKRLEERGGVENQEIFAPLLGRKGPAPLLEMRPEEMSSSPPLLSSTLTNRSPFRVLCHFCVYLYVFGDVHVQVNANSEAVARFLDSGIAESENGFGTHHHG